MTDIPLGLCGCGCGRRTSVVTHSDRRTGVKRGDLRRFIAGHHLARSGSKNSRWKGGRLIRAGYVQLKQPDHPHARKDGYVLEHIVVACEMLGRTLAPGEVVHHRNRDRADNRPENLQVCRTQTEHVLIHTQEDAFAACGHADWRKCPYCHEYDDVANMASRRGRYHVHVACEGAASKRNKLAARERTINAEGRLRRMHGPTRAAA
jgi:hypothetical protein